MDGQTNLKSEKNAETAIHVNTHSHADGLKQQRLLYRQTDGRTEVPQSPTIATSFFDASSNLYKGFCPSFHSSVGPSIRPQVRHAFVKNKGNPHSSKTVPQAYQIQMHPRISLSWSIRLSVHRFICQASMNFRNLKLEEVKKNLVYSHHHVIIPLT